MPAPASTPPAGTVERASATLNADGTCGTFGAYGGSYTSPDTSVQDGRCYTYRFTIADAVGNVSTPVETSAREGRHDRADRLADGARRVRERRRGRPVHRHRRRACRGRRPGRVLPLLRSPAPAARAARGSRSASTPARRSASRGRSTPRATGPCARSRPTTPATPARTRRDTTIDRTAPSGGSVAYADGYAAPSVTITTDDGTDAVSGIDPGSGVIERDEAPLSGGNCAAFPDAWTTVTSPDSIATGTCYRYRYRVADLAGNEATYTSPNVVKVDASPPSTPGVSLSESSPFELVTGTTIYYNPSPATAARSTSPRRPPTASPGSPRSDSRPSSAATRRPRRRARTPPPTRGTTPRTRSASRPSPPRTAPD